MTEMNLTLMMIWSPK